MTRTAGDGGRPPTWSEDDASQSDEAFGNFMARLEQLSITGFPDPPSRDEITGVVRVDYYDTAGDELGFMELYRTTPSSPDDVVSYHVLTERTRMLAGAVRTLAERVDQDLIDIF